MSIPSRDRVRIYILGLVISLSCGFNPAFSNTYMNGSVNTFKQFLNDSFIRRDQVLSQSGYSWLWATILNVWFPAFLLGQFLNPIVNEKLGRKLGSIVFNVLALIASSLRFVSILIYSPELLIASTVLASVASAITYNSMILMLQECAPTTLRGNVATLAENSYAFISLIGIILSLESVLGSDLRWLTAFALIPCTLAIIMMIPLHETPKHIYLTTKDVEKTHRSIYFYHGMSTDVNEVVEEMKLEINIENEEDSSVKEILKTPHLRKAFVLGCAALLNVLGIWPLMLSSTDFLQRVGITSSFASQSSIVLMVLYLIGAIGASFFINNYGRRPILLLCASANALSLIGFVLAARLHYYLDFFKYFCIIFLIAYAFAYGSGVGTVVWYLNAELVLQRHRSRIQMMCSVFIFPIIFITTFTLFSLYDVIEEYAFLLLFVLPAVGSIVYLYKELPETGGREIHDIVSELQAIAGERRSTESTVST
ncbi:unnamed protein product [Bursaphelenchus okinawaensis]|uniref:Major facilitator superfamily (MFS) profile domain-containing protein n=1 Tax=Bursaphelenchus okinawaensis TaxID=465554 RepID=A0A811LNX4_9BILA|nr:unnamed protein product [Bursaphelenchus okinawaensis]CAG9125160.1 unnamed protein product [Bursaphelenchus okinawaensis]